MIAGRALAPGREIRAIGFPLLAGATEANFTRGQWSAIAEPRQVRRIVGVGASADVTGLSVFHPERLSRAATIDLIVSRTATVGLDFPADLNDESVRVTMNALAGNTTLLFLLEVETCPSP